MNKRILSLNAALLMLLNAASAMAVSYQTREYGDKGSDVRQMQQRLKELGYYKGSVDGVYGSGTIKAVRAFQERNRLTADGVAGPSTQKVLYSSAAKKAEEKSPNPTSRTTSRFAPALPAMP